MSIKISFMHYRNYITWKRVKLSVVFEEFDMVYFFWLLFPFHYHCQLVKGKLQQKSGFYRPELKIIINYLFSSVSLQIERKTIIILYCEENVH